MSWLHANAIPFLVRKNHIDPRNRFNPRFMAPRAMMTLLVPLLTGRAKLKRHFLVEHHYEFKLRTADAAVFRLRFDNYREIGIAVRHAEFIGQAVSVMLAKEIIGTT